MKSVAKPAPPTSWVGESGVRSSGCSSSSACSRPQQLVELAVGDDRRVTHVVAELVFAHLVGEFLPLPAQVGVGGTGFGFGVCRAHPGRLSKRTDTRTGVDRRRLAESVRSLCTGQANLDAMPHPIMFGDDDFGLAELRDITLDFPEAIEKISHGRPVFCAPKMFAVYGGSTKTTGEMVRFSYSVLVKVDESERVALERDPRFFYPMYLGPIGWLGP